MYTNSFYGCIVKISKHFTSVNISIIRSKVGQFCQSGENVHETMLIKQLDVWQIGVQNSLQTMSLKLESSRFVNKETIALEVIWLFKNAIDSRRKTPLWNSFFKIKISPVYSCCTSKIEKKSKGWQWMKTA